ncbi:type VII secretion integral membrane protein EccD [Actinoplanes palleronii]|uniref:type VII secretion integral membrane protein EccD n=1 Tax=Actinoplanes palleronii TaxID=113570 RepID=UPI001941B49E|nr:type VII secretion integral membrane protein EccD [Actinoplanes palleronii]
MYTGLARVTISAPHRRVDVALPEHVPLAELLPEVLRHAGTDLADAGERHGGWVLRRADGTVLEVGRGLHSQGVRDGEVLHLRPAHDEWPELEYDDVVEAVAEGARRRGGAWTPAATRATALTLAGVALTAGLAALIAADLRGDGAGWTGLGLAALLVLAATAAARAYAARSAAVVLGAFALPYAFTGAATLIAAAGTPTGPGGPGAASTGWPGATGIVAAGIGGPELLAGSVATLVAAVLCGVGTAAGARIFTAGVTVGTLGALAAFTALAGGPAAGAAALLAVLVCGVSVLPVLAIRLGRTPMPPVALPLGTAAEEDFFTTPAELNGAAERNDAAEPGSTAERDGSALDAIRRRPDRAVVFAAVGRADDLLTGLLLGHAVLVAGSVAVLATVHTLAARLLLGAAAVALLLRSRLFRARRQRLPLIAGGLAGCLALGAGLLADAGPAAMPAVTAGCVLLALLLAAAGETWPSRPSSRWPARAADLLDVLATVSVIPVACAVAGLYQAVSGIPF